MARTNRLSRTSTAAQLTFISRQLLVLILAVVIGVLVSVATVNAQTASEKKNVKTKKEKVHKFRFRNRVNFYADAGLDSDKKKKQVKRKIRASAPPRKSRPRPTVDADVVQEMLAGAAPRLGDLQFVSRQQLIRELVAQRLREDNNSPIEISPLTFTLRENRVSVKDVNPFLIALEFGLTGKIIMIENQSVAANAYSRQLNWELALEVKSLLRSMGANDVRIAAEGFEQIADSTLPLTSSKLNFRIL